MDISDKIKKGFGKVLSATAEGIHKVERYVYSTANDTINEIRPTPDNYNNITKETLSEDEYKQAEEKCKRYSFTMQPVEYARYWHFLNDHRDCRYGKNGMHRFGTIGGGVRVSFVGTGLGDLVSVTCDGCGKTVDITDVTTW